MTRLLRGVFIVLIVLTLGWKLVAPPPRARNGDAATAITAVLTGRLAGVVTGRPWGVSTNPNSIFSAPVAGCTAPLIVVTAPARFTEASALEQVQRPGDHHLFAYMDWVSDQPDRWRLLQLRIQEKAQAMLGMNALVSTDTMLFIAEPTGCQVARSVPWRDFWTPR